MSDALQKYSHTYKEWKRRNLIILSVVVGGGTIVVALGAAAIKLLPQPTPAHPSITGILLLSGGLLCLVVATMWSIGYMAVLECPRCGKPLPYVTPGMFPKACVHCGLPFKEIRNVALGKAGVS